MRRGLRRARGSGRCRGRSHCPRNRDGADHHGEAEERHDHPEGRGSPPPLHRSTVLEYAPRHPRPRRSSSDPDSLAAGRTTVAVGGISDLHIGSVDRRSGPKFGAGRRDRLFAGPGPAGAPPGQGCWLLTETISPVMYEARSDARNTMTFAISHGSAGAPERLERRELGEQLLRSNTLCCVLYLVPFVSCYRIRTARTIPTMRSPFFSPLAGPGSNTRPRDSCPSTGASAGGTGIFSFHDFGICATHSNCDCFHRVPNPL